MYKRSMNLNTKFQNDFISFHKKEVEILSLQIIIQWAQILKFYCLTYG